MNQTSPSMASSVTSSIDTLFQKQKAAHYRLGETTARQRIEKLKALKKKIFEQRAEITQALYSDFRKAPMETEVTEIFPVIGEIEDTCKNLKKWMRPVRVSNPWTLLGSHSHIRSESKGVVLIIGPWNYPFHLVIAPLVSAIAAGNSVILKPSELAVHTSQLITRLIQSCFSEEEVAVVEGGVDVSTHLLQKPFDHIFFTGSTRVGQIVMEAAAKNLTPITLELGGKSPAIFDDSADFHQSAERLVWGKFVNAGQTCIAPDYVLVPENRLQELLQHTRQAITRFYGQSASEQEQSASYCRIINPGNFQRLKRLVDDTVQQGAKIELGGHFNEAARFISPTLLSGVQPHHPIMSDEIFGPLLPILTYRSLDEVLQLVQSRPKPLALYIFSQNGSRIEHLLRNTRAGGTCINAALLHIASPNLPFGGIGPSGIGSYHGHFGFKAFSHERSVFRLGLLDLPKLFFPPYRSFQGPLMNLAQKLLTK